VVTVNSIRNKLAEATALSDRVAEMYWYGRLVDILVNFEPIDMEMDLLDDESYDYFNPNVYIDQTTGGGIFPDVNLISVDRRLQALNKLLIKSPVVGQEDDTQDDWFIDQAEDADAKGEEETGETEEGEEIPEVDCTDSADPLCEENEEEAIDEDAVIPSNTKCGPNETCNGFN
jgi:hypothetical protein